MKKILIFVISLFYFVSNVNAASTLCEYTYQVNHVDENTFGSDQISAIFNVKIQISIDGSTDSDGTPIYTFTFSDKCDKETGVCLTDSIKGGSATTLNENHVIISDASIKKLDEGECPDKAYVDLYNLKAWKPGDNEICVGTGTECESQSDNGNWFTEEVDQVGWRLNLKSHPVLDNKLATNSEMVKNIILNNIKNSFAKTDANCDNFKNFNAENIVQDASLAAQTWLNTTYSDAGPILWGLTTKNLGAENFAMQANTYFKELEGYCENKIKNDSNLTEEEKEKKIKELKDSYVETINDLSEQYKDNFGFSYVENYDFENSCEGYLGDPEIKGTPAYYLRYIMKIIKYLAIILALILSIIDFVKAVTSQDKDLLQKAIMSSVKRLIFAVVIFFIPILLDFILGLIGSYSTCL